MTLSDFRRITDELLSAYIDGEVSEQERNLIEAAIAADEEIAWRLNSLRQTVNLLRELPEVTLPRSFTLTLEQAAAVHAEQQAGGMALDSSPSATPQTRAPSAPRTAVPHAESLGLWGQLQQGWREFWQAGNPVLRNAAAVSFALMLVLAGGGQILNSALTESAGMSASVPVAEPVTMAESSEAAPAEAVAMVSTASPEAAQQAQTDQAQDGAAANNKRAVEEDAGVMQAETAPGEVPASSERAATVTETADSMEQESAADDSQVVDEGEAAIAGTAAATIESAASPAADTASEQTIEEQAVGEQAASDEATVEATVEEPAAAAAMAAPMVAEQAPYPGPPVANGQGNGMGGGGPDGPGIQAAPGYGVPDTGFPPQAYTFDADPMSPTVVPAEEAVSASVAAVPAEETPAEAPADMAATPAVDAPVVASASAVTEITSVTETTTETTEVVETTEVTETAADRRDADADGDTAATGAADPTVEPTALPTADTVALAAPESITSSTVVQDAPVDETASLTGVALNLPVVWVAQGATIFLTIVLASLWWRSRTTSRRNR